MAGWRHRSRGHRYRGRSTGPGPRAHTPATGTRRGRVARVWPAGCAIRPTSGTLHATVHPGRRRVRDRASARCAPTARAPAALRGIQPGMPVASPCHRCSSSTIAGSCSARYHACQRRRPPKGTGQRQRPRERVDFGVAAIRMAGGSSHDSRVSGASDRCAHPRASRSRLRAMKRAKW